MSARPFVWPSPYDIPPPPQTPAPIQPRPPATTRRRSLLGAVAAFTVAPAVVQASEPASLDAELIRLCGAFIAIRNAYNAYDGPWDANNEHPMEEEMAGIEARLDSVEPVTLAGIAALARVALEEGEQPDGYFSHAASGPWMERVTRAVLRLTGGAA